MANDIESTLLARALRLQKSVNADTAVDILTKDITTDYGASPLLAKHIAIAALDGNGSLLKDLSSHLNPKDRHYSTDHKTLPTPSGSPMHVLEMIQTDRPGPGMEKKGEPPATGDPNPGVKKSDEPCDPCLEKTLAELVKALPADCGHCDNNCTCGRAAVKSLYSLTKADDKPEKKDDKKSDGGDKKEGGDKKSADSKKPMGPGGSEAPPAPEELPLPETGGVAGADMMSAAAPPAPAPAAPPAGDPMSALMVAAEITQLVNATVTAINDLIGGAAAPPMDVPPADPSMMTEPIDPVAPGAPPGAPAPVDPVPPGGTKGLYLEDEGGAVPASRHGLRMSADRLRKALKKDDAPMMTSTPAAHHPVVDGSVKPKKKVAAVAKAIFAARDAQENLLKANRPGGREPVRMSTMDHHHAHREDIKAGKVVSPGNIKATLKRHDDSIKPRTQK